MQTNNILKGDDTQVIYYLKSDDYSLYCEERIPEKEYFCEVFIKFKESIRYMAHVYFQKPTVVEILLDVKNYGDSSRRPYKAGQTSDGSIHSPVFHLYNQLCRAFSFDPIECFNIANRDLEIIQEDLDYMIEFAEWQGVEIIKEWNTRNIFRVLESLTEINNHALRNVIEQKLETSF